MGVRGGVSVPAMVLPFGVVTSWMCVFLCTPVACL